MRFDVGFLHVGKFAEWAAMHPVVEGGVKFTLRSSRREEPHSSALSTAWVRICLARSLFLPILRLHTLQIAPESVARCVGSVFEVCECDLHKGKAVSILPSQPEALWWVDESR